MYFYLYILMIMSIVKGWQIGLAPNQRVLEAYPGKTYTIICQVFLEPHEIQKFVYPYIKWSKDGEEVGMDKLLVRGLTKKQALTRKVLNLKNIQHSDNGHYQCDVTVDGEARSQSIEVKVKGSAIPPTHATSRPDSFPIPILTTPTPKPTYVPATPFRPMALPFHGNHTTGNQEKSQEMTQTNHCGTEFLPTSGPRPYTQIVRPPTAMTQDPWQAYREQYLQRLQEIEARRRVQERPNSAQPSRSPPRVDDRFYDYYRRPVYDVGVKNDIPKIKVIKQKSGNWTTFVIPQNETQKISTTATTTFLATSTTPSVLATTSSIPTMTTSNPKPTTIATTFVDPTLEIPTLTISNDVVKNLHMARDLDESYPNLPIMFDGIKPDKRSIEVVEQLEIRDQLANLKFEAKILCEIDGDVDSIKWSKDDKVLKENTKYTFEDFGTTLVISDFSDDDNGLYKCEWSTSETKGAKEIQINVSENLGTKKNSTSGIEISENLILFLVVIFVVILIICLISVIMCT